MGSAQRRGGRGRRAVMIGGAVLVALVVLGQIGALLFARDTVEGDLELVRGDQPGLRVLLVGNAITANNAMISMLRGLADADAGAPRLFAVQYAPRGSELRDAARDDDLLAVLDDERWNAVVLQEHSQTADRRWAVAERGLAAATKLDALARDTGARTVLLRQGGYDDGDPDVDGDTYRAMQDRLRAGYAALNARLRADVAPVDTAWADSRVRNPGIELYGNDGIRPSREGSYLIACVLYAVLTKRDPAVRGFTGGLDAADARALQQSARRAVSQPIEPAPSA